MVRSEQGCTFCEALIQPKIPFEVSQPTEDGNISILYALGMLESGYLLAVTNEHVTSIAQLDRGALRKVDRSLTKIEDQLTPLFGDYFRFESGSDNVIECGGAGGCIDHAHVHLVPAATDVVPHILGILRWREERKEIEIKKLTKYEDLKNYQGEPYAYLGVDGSHFVVPRPGLHGQWMRRELAKTRNLPVWDWGLYEGRPELAHTLSVLHQTKAGVLKPLARATLEFMDSDVLSNEEKEASRDEPYDLGPDWEKDISQFALFCLEYVIKNPKSAMSIERAGTHEGTYVMDIGEIAEGSVMRVHFYSGEGAKEVKEEDLRRSPIDITKLGVPHNHRADVWDFIYKGRLIHHMFEKKEGSKYREGKINYVPTKDDSPEAPEGKRSVILPGEPCDLGYKGDFETSWAYRMNGGTIHVASWPEPTISVSLEYMGPEHILRPIRAYYPRGADIARIERLKPLTKTEQQEIWKSIVELALS